VQRCWLHLRRHQLFILLFRFGGSCIIYIYHILCETG
jgi:hypothetical protein